VDQQNEGEEISPIARAFTELLRTHKDPDGKPVSIESLAAKLNRKGLSAPYLYALRSGRKRNPSADTLQVLADYFGVHVGFFFGGPRGGRSVSGVEATAVTPVDPHDSAHHDSGGTSRTAQSVGEVDLAARIEHLFTLRLNANGDPWSMRQVMLEARARGVALSVTFLHDLRRGIKDNPSKQQLECLAEIFGVSPGYFFDDASTIERVNDKLRYLGALEDPRVADIALRARGLSDHDYRMLRALIDSAANARDNSGLPPRQS
jgi:transcriptional regulator with XRE-family HTH domain